MKTFFFIANFISYLSITFAQANLIQSIDFDSQGRVVYGLTGPYDYSYAVRYEDSVFESWNITQIFSLEFFFISTVVDNNDDMWVFMQDKLYKLDNTNWITYDIPSPPQAYLKYSDLSYHNGSLWVSTYYDGIYHNSGVWKYDIDDDSWTIYSPDNSNFPEYSQHGTFFHDGDSTWIGTTEGLVLIHNDLVSVELDTTYNNLTTQKIYCFYIDSNRKRWFGTYSKGLVNWVNDTSFIYYNASNSILENNFINAIDEDSKGTLWLATDKGFAAFKDDSIISYSNFTDRSIATLAVDDKDNIWMGEVGTGKLLLFNNNHLQIITKVEDTNSSYPGSYLLSQNYPNPFNPSTVISYQLPVSSEVQIKIYDILGREVQTLVNKTQAPGNYEIEFDGSTLASGIYFYQLRAGEFISTKKMILIK